MAQTRLQAFKAVLHPGWAKVVFWGPIAASVYQFGCDQFDLPKLPKLWGMTSAAFPWWGWLVIAQAGFVYALFEYVRRAFAVANEPTAVLRATRPSRSI